MEKHNINPALISYATPINSILLEGNNSREHGEGDLKELARSYDEFGQRKPIIVNTRGTFPDGIIGVVEAGNGTLMAVKDILGWTHIAALLVDDDGETARRYAIADNRTAELSKWSDKNMRVLFSAMDDPQSIPGIDQTFMEIIMDAPDNLDDYVFDTPKYKDKSKATIIIEDSDAFSEFLSDLNTLLEMNDHWDAELRIG